METLATEEQILNLIKDKNNVMKQVSEFAAAHAPHQIRDRVSWQRCRPVREIPLQRTETWHCSVKQETFTKYTTLGSDSTVHVAHDTPIDLIPDDTVPNFIDAEHWDPELGVGGFLGIYHQWHMLTGGGRELKLYIVCQSSCQKAGLEIKHIVNDIPYQTTMFDFASSEEMWWLGNVLSLIHI